MDQLKTYIQSLPILEQIALSAWLAKLIQDEVENRQKEVFYFWILTIVKPLKAANIIPHFPAYEFPSEVGGASHTLVQF